VNETLEFYDLDEFNRISENSHSFLHDFLDSTVRGIRAIFGERKGVIRVDAEFTLQNFKAILSREGDHSTENSMPNPHIYFFGCDGANGQYYSQYAESGEWDLAIEQAIAATKNLNWGDSTVCKRMLRWIEENAYTPFIYVDNGTPIEKVTKDMKLVSFMDFLTLIEPKEQEEQNG
jgi:hypothetical protein